MRPGVLAVLALAAVLCPAQQAPDAVTLARAGRLGDALRAADAAAKAQPTGKNYQILGLLLCETGRFSLAEDAFAKAVAAGPQRPDTTGLEDVALPSLRQLRGAFVRGSGEAAARNDLGLVRLFLGRRVEAFEEFDKATVLDGSLSAPWLNGAVAWNQAGRFAEAAKAAKTAQSLGDMSATCLAVAAEAEVGLGLLDDARRDLAAALARQPDNATALVVQASLAESTGDFQTSAKSMAKAVAASRLALLGSDLSSGAGSDEAFGGSFGEEHVDLGHHGLLAGGLGYKFAAKLDKLHVEDRSEADQARGSLALSATSRDTAFVFNLSNFYGGRPGALDPVAGINPDPTERARFTNLDAFATQSLGDWTLHGAYRRSFVDTHSQSNPAQRLNDTEWLGEFRYLKAARSDTVVGGFSYVTLDRTKSAATVIDPADAVLPDGDQNLWTGYLVDRRALGQRLTLDFGALLTSAEKRMAVSPVLSLTRDLGQGSAVHLGLRPRVNGVAGDLIPDFLLADDNQSNPIDRVQQSTIDFNSSPLLLGNQGRLDSFELKWDLRAGPLQQWQFCLFHDRLSDVYAQGADPRVASSLLLTPLSDARTTGLAVSLRQLLQDGSRLGGFFQVQSTEGETRFSTLDAGSWPGSVPVSDHRIPDVPALRAGASWIKSWDDFLACVSLEYVGPRLHAVTAAGSGLTYLEDADAQTGVSLRLAQRLGPQSRIEATFYNLGRAHFYPGYPGAPSVLLGVVVRF